MTRRPSKGNIVYGFGMRLHPVLGYQRMHNGEDIGWGNDAGFILVAPQRSQLIACQDRGDWGTRVDLRAGTTEHRLAHTYGLVAGVKIGDWIDEGQPVAVMGDTGMAEGRHVHWEVLIDGKYVDPAAWLARTASSTARPFRIPNPFQRKDRTMRTIYNKDDKNEETRRAAVGELTFEVQGKTAAARERKLWGAPVNVAGTEWRDILATVNKRRKQAGLPALKGTRGE